VDSGPAPRRPDEDLQGVGAVGAVVTVSHVPVLGPFCSLEEREGLQKLWFPHQTGQEGSGFSQGRLCGKLGEPFYLS
jgi:hypothetical protein